MKDAFVVFDIPAVMIGNGLGFGLIGGKLESVRTIVDGKIVYGAQEFRGIGPAPLPVLPEWSPVKAYGEYGAPLDVRKAARAGIPVLQHQHTAYCHEQGCLHAAHQLLAGIKAAAPRYSDFWGLCCDRLRFLSEGPFKVKYR